MKRKNSAGRLLTRFPAFLPRIVTAYCCLAGMGMTAVAGPVIFSDNFDAPDTGDLDNSEQTGRRGGILGEGVQVRSAMIQHGILDNQLKITGYPTGEARVRFHDAADFTNWWDFASGETGQLIAGDGGMRVAFDWTPPDNTSDNWVSWDIGVAPRSAGIEPESRIITPTTDFGILFRRNGGTQYFDSGVGAVGGDFDVSEVKTHRIVIDFRFDSFADGADVTVSASVDGVEVLTDYVFQWEGNEGVLNMELGDYLTGTLFDNLSISTLAPDGYVLRLADIGAGGAFYSSVAAGARVGTLSALNGETAEPSTFTLVAGAGDTDNAKFKITGDRLESNGFDFRTLADGTTLSIRVNGVGTVPERTVTQQITLKIIADTDADQLPDVWEMAKAGNLTSLNGAAAGPGPGTGTGDFDGDTLTDLQEYVLSTTTHPNISPVLADTDGDGLPDNLELAGAGSRLPTNPTLADTDGDGLSDGVESATGVLAGPADSGSNPLAADSDGDLYQDDFEFLQGSDPNDPNSLPTQPAGITITELSTDEASGISTDKIYTHAISGGYAVTINGVDFEKLGPGVIPGNFSWEASGGLSEIAAFNLNDWSPDNGGLTGDGLRELFGGFSYSANGANPGSTQTYTLSGLVPGQSYEAQLYLREWDKGASGRPIDFLFTNGTQTQRAFVPADRPHLVAPLTNPEAAYAMGFAYTAQGTELVITAKVPVSAPVNSGSLHFYGLTHEETAAIPAAPSFAITAIGYQSSPSPAVTLSFESVAGKSYVIQTSTTLTAAGQPGGWTDLATVAATSTSTTHTDSVRAGTGTVLFYRVALRE